jgi:integrase
VESAANTVRALGESWFTELAEHRSATWRENARRWLDDRIYPELGSRPADSVEPAEILALIRRVAEEGHAKTAEYIRQTLSRIFQHGVRNLRCKGDPAHACRGAIIVPPATHHRPLSAKELPGFLESIDNYAGRRPTVIAGQLLLLTIVRKSELIGARWNELEVDGAEPLWRVPGERMKGGVDHLVPLSRQAAALFRELKPLSCGSEYMFPHLGSLDKPMSKSTLNAMFDRLKLDVTPHAIRATASTLMNESGLFRSDVIERVLAHVERNRVRASYNAAEYLPERRKILQWWADYLDGLRAGGDVVAFKRPA